MEFLLGVASGLITTFIFWLVKNKISPPKVDFGNDISRVTYPSGKHGYIIIYTNVGHRRLIDINVKVIVKIPEIVTWDKSLTQTFYIKTTAENRFLLERGHPTTTRIVLEDSDELLKSGLIPRDIKKKIKDKKFALDELLKLNANAQMKIFLLGNDESTGVRKIFESKYYSIADIKDGKFNRKRMLVEN